MTFYSAGRRHLKCLGINIFSGETGVTGSQHSPCDDEFTPSELDLLEADSDNTLSPAKRRKVVQESRPTSSQVDPSNAITHSRSPTPNNKGNPSSKRKADSDITLSPGKSGVWVIRDQEVTNPSRTFGGGELLRPSHGDGPSSGLRSENPSLKRKPVGKMPAKYRKKLDFGGTSNNEAGKDNESQRAEKLVVEETNSSFTPLFFLEQDSDSEGADGDLESDDVGSDVEDEGDDDSNVNSEADGLSEAGIDDATTSNSTVETTPAADDSKRRRKCKPLKNCRRRTHEESEKSKRKRAHNSGLGYITDKGKVKEPRKIGPACKNSCKRCEHPRISEDERETHFRELWASGSATARYDYISRLVTSYEPKSSNTLPERAKQHIKVYRLKKSDGKLQKVCKPMFLQTFGINHSVVETAFRKVSQKGNITPDKRGTGERKNKTSEDQKRSIRRHIEQIARVPSHYCRTRTRKEYYFEFNLNFERLYKLYCEWVVDTGLPKEEKDTKSMYREVFMTENNIGFNEPLSDQCFTHARWRNGSNEETKEMMEEYKNHLSWYNFVKKTKAEEKAYAASEEGGDYCIACFDLQKVLTLPRSSISCMFYLRKVSLYNFTVFELSSRSGFCYLWNETVAHRGANEVGSSLLRFFERMVSHGKRRFTLYSDSPTGQNRNRMIFSLWLHLAVKHGISVTHRFFESGHSFSEVDSMQGQIEKETRDKEIFHPDQWVQHILNAKQNGEKYIVDFLTTETCLDFHVLVDELYWDKDTDRESVKWNTVKQVRVDSNQPDSIFFKYGADQPEKEIVVNRKGVDLALFQFKQAETGLIPLSENKVKDIKFMMEKEKAIPPKYRDFYRSLPGMEKAK